MYEMRYTVLVAVLALSLLPVANAIYDSTTDTRNYNPPYGDVYVSQLRYDPFPASPGQYVDVWYKIDNAGDSELQNVMFTIIPEFPFSIDSNDVSAKKVGTLGAHSSALVKFKVRVSESALQGDQPLKYTWSADGASNIGIMSSDISVRSANSLLVVSNAKATPETISPSGQSTIEIEVANVGDSFIRYATVSLQLVMMAGTTPVELPFTPVGKGISETLMNIAPGDKGTVKFPVIANANAASQTYKVPISINYIDASGRNMSRAEMVGITVHADPDIITYIDKSAIRDTTTPGEVTIRFVNKGRSDIKFLTATLQETDKYLLISSPTQYVGQVNSDDYETASWTLKLKSQQSSVDLPLVVSYEDANGKKYSTGMSVPLAIHTAQDLGQTTNNYTTYIIGIVFVLVIGFLIYRSRKSRKKRTE
jgi:hypothetical protein